MPTIIGCVPRYSSLRVYTNGDLFEDGRVGVNGRRVWRVRERDAPGGTINKLFRRLLRQRHQSLRRGARAQRVSSNPGNNLTLSSPLRTGRGSKGIGVGGSDDCRRFSLPPSFYLYFSVKLLNAPDSRDYILY